MVTLGIFSLIVYFIVFICVSMCSYLDMGEPGFISFAKGVSWPIGAARKISCDPKIFWTVWDKKEDKEL